MGSSSTDRLATCKAGFEGRTVDSGEFSGPVRAASNKAISKYFTPFSPEEERPLEESP
jgi:hypothetical protein